MSIVLLAKPDGSPANPHGSHDESVLGPLDHIEATIPGFSTFSTDGVSSCAVSYWDPLFRGFHLVLDTLQKQSSKC